MQLHILLVTSLLGACQLAELSDREQPTVQRLDTLTTNRDRLVRTLSGFPRSAELCAGYQTLPSSAKQIFLLVTDRLQKAKLADGSSMLSHVEWVGAVAGKGEGCGGIDHNRVFLRIDDTLQAALARVHAGSGELTDAGTRNAPGWEASRDRPHAPFDTSIETTYGPLDVFRMSDVPRVLRGHLRSDAGPRMQLHFFRDAWAPRPHAPRGGFTVPGNGNWIEIDQDFDLLHRSAVDPSCKYGGRTGSDRYAAGLGDYEPGYLPCDCRPVPSGQASACGLLEDCDVNPTQPECAASGPGELCHEANEPCWSDNDCCGAAQGAYCHQVDSPEGPSNEGYCANVPDGWRVAPTSTPTPAAAAECLSCSQLGQVCGPIDTGCGTEVTCGACTPGLACLEGSCASYGMTTCDAGAVRLGARGARFSAAGGVQTIGVDAPWCAWTPRADAGWVAVRGSSPGAGSVQLVAPPSTGRARIALVDVEGARLGVLQDGTTAPFGDVPASHPFAPYIDLLAQARVTTGCAPGLYCPDASITRVQMAMFVIRALYGGDAFAYPTTPYFTDVPPGAIGFAHVQKLRELGITSGCSPTTYCPDQPVTRGQAAVFLVRAALGEGFAAPGTPYFTDVPATHYFFRHIQKLRELGVTAGCSATTYCPDAPVTRGQMAVFVVRMFGAVP